MLVPGLGDLPVFACRPNKHPGTTHGFYDAKPVEPPDAWSLVGVRAGEASGIDCLDIDPSGEPWYRENFDAIPLTRTHETRRRSLHLLFRHAPGLGKSEERIAKGVDVRADGSYFIWWPREGLPFEDHPLSEWPDWLLKEAMGQAHASHSYIPRAPLQSANANGLDTALNKLDPTAWRDYGSWIRLLMSAKAAGVSPDAFIAWSISDPPYADHADKILYLWNSHKSNGGITAATFFAALKGEPQAIPTPPADGTLLFRLNEQL